MPVRGSGERYKLPHRIRAVPGRQLDFKLKSTHFPPYKITTVTKYYHWVSKAIACATVLNTASVTVDQQPKWVSHKPNLDPNSNPTLPNYYLLFIYLFICSQNVTYILPCTKRAGQKAQVTGTNSCPLSLNHTATDTSRPTMQCN